MPNFSFFRRKLAHHLRACARRRLDACKDHPSGTDLKTIRLFERLAGETDAVPQTLIDEAAQLCTDPAYARRFNAVWDSLFEVVGTFMVPMRASDLVRWMIDQAHYETDDGGAGQDTRSTPRANPTPLRRDASTSLLAGMVDDFTGALALVGPMMAMWEGSIAVRQWRDQAFIARHAAIPATVVSSHQEPGGRTFVPDGSETLSFAAFHGGAACRIAVPLKGHTPASLGQTVMVVPRPGDCGMPLIPGAIGDPFSSLIVAAAFLASGIASWKVWSGLRVPASGKIRRSPTPQAGRMRIAL